MRGNSGSPKRDQPACWNSPEVGATFDGHNRNGDKSWTTQGKVVEADVGRAFTFECSAGDFHYATWGYRMELLSIGETAAELGVAVGTLRRWHRQGLLMPFGRTVGGHRRYQRDTVRATLGAEPTATGKTVLEQLLGPISPDGKQVADDL